jgi:hypothetical protein
MTFTITLDEYWKLIKETDQANPQKKPLSRFETLSQMPSQIGTGIIRWIEPTPELEVEIAYCQLHQELAIQVPVREHDIELIIMLSGKVETEYGEMVLAGQSHLIGSGIAPQGTTS